MTTTYILVNANTGAAVATGTADEIAGRVNGAYMAFPIGDDSVIGVAADFVIAPYDEGDMVVTAVTHDGATARTRISGHVIAGTRTSRVNGRRIVDPLDTGREVNLYIWTHSYAQVLADALMGKKPLALANYPA